MLISCIVPAYHNKNDLYLTVESINRLQCENSICSIQIIIIDGSRHPLLSNQEIIVMNSNFSSFLYLNEPDNGPYDAMNKGLQQVNGDWIWFLNSGDRALSLPSWRHLGGTHNIIIGAWISEVNNKLIKPSKDLGLSSSTKTEPGCGLCHQAMLFKADKYKSKRYEGDIYKYAAELQYYIEDILCSNYAIDHTFVCSYNNKVGLSKSKAIKHLRESLKVYKRHNIRVSFLRLIRRYASACISSLRANHSRRITI